MRPVLAAALAAALLAVPASAAPDKSRPTAADDAAEIADKLLDRIDFEPIQEISIRGMIDILQEKLGYTILVDYKTILGSDGDAPGSRQAFEQQIITVPALKRVRLETALRQVLDQINADFYIEADHVRVTTGGVKDLAVGPRRVLPELRPCADEAPPTSEFDLGTQMRHTATVTAAFKDVPLADALRAVSRRTGRAVAVNPDAGEKAKAPVSMVLTNAPFETAVSVLAEAAGLRAYRTGNAAVLVTPERARRMEEGGPPGGLCNLSGYYPPGTDAAEATRRDLTRLEAERQALDERVKALTAEVEKLKKR